MASTRNSSPSVDLAARTSNCLGQFVQSGDRLVAALSGGADSVLLLHVLRKLSQTHGFRLSALHVNHGISQNAGCWQSFCERLCEAWGIRLDVKQVVVERGGGEGLEAAARRARYDAFAESDAEWLVLAHHRNDQAETLLFNLLRGAGVCGAAAMPMVRVFPGRTGLRVLRPLLEVTREEIETCARSEGLLWMEDESNVDARHSRNFLRHRIFPLLRERFPGCDAVLARAAAHFAEGDVLLSQLAEIDARTALREGRIQVAELCRLDEARARNLLRHVLKRAGIAMPDSARLHEAVRQVCHAAADRQVRVDLGQCQMYRYRGELWLAPAMLKPGAADWHGESVLTWGQDTLRFGRTEGGGIGLDRLAGKAVRILPRRGGERFRPDVRRPKRELKKLLQEHGVPPWQRDIMPLLWCGEELVWVPGIGIDCAWQCRVGEAGLLPAWEQA
jgi:tRNA(Ile)-lysidine synthase